MLVISTPVRANAAADSSPFPGEKSTWNGYDRFDFEVDGKPVLVVVPEQPAPGRPWVWHGEFFGHKPAPDVALLGEGFHVVYMRVPDMLGCPRAVEHGISFFVYCWYGDGQGGPARMRFGSAIHGAPKEHVDLVPDDIGMGSYDRAYRRHVEAGYRPAR